MTEQAVVKSLRLPSLSISGFRGLDNLEIDRLGRVTLIAGRNGTGKTTVLDAVRIFAERGHVSSLLAVLTRNEEVAEHVGVDDKPFDIVSFEALFHGRTPVLGSTVAVGPSGSSKSGLRLELVPGDPRTMKPGGRLRRDTNTRHPDLKVSFDDFEGHIPMLFDLERQMWGGNSRWSSRSRFDDKDWPDSLNYCSLGPGLLDNWELDKLWGEITLTSNEPLAIRALRFASDLGIEDLAVVPGANRHSDRRVVVRLKSGQRVPLRSLGDGAARLFSTAIALGSASNGFLLIDEAENGIHHSLQQEYWGFVLKTAEANNVQVIATTHSWDCISGFAAAAREHHSSEAVFFRLERDDCGVSVVDYGEEDLDVATAQGTEVR
ncbi:MAG: AAA family ATPase [Acidimicrobiia bacterium]|nr:AAA family ATPase [Acidimicrobiia bacterium]MCY4435138.1 AAA family ATPase [bacterium]